MQITNCSLRIKNVVIHLLAQLILFIQQSPFSFLTCHYLSQFTFFILLHGSQFIIINQTKNSSLTAWIFTEQKFIMQSSFNKKYCTYIKSWFIICTSLVLPKCEVKDLLACTYASNCFSILYNMHLMKEFCQILYSLFSEYCSGCSDFFDFIVEFNNLILKSTILDLFWKKLIDLPILYLKVIEKIQWLHATIW